jgi:hypothetical protein
VFTVVHLIFFAVFFAVFFAIFFAIVDGSFFFFSFDTDFLIAFGFDGVATFFVPCVQCVIFDTTRTPAFFAAASSSALGFLLIHCAFGSSKACDDDKFAAALPSLISLFFTIRYTISRSVISPSCLSCLNVSLSNTLIVRNSVCTHGMKEQTKRML